MPPQFLAGGAPSQSCVPSGLASQSGMAVPEEQQGMLNDLNLPLGLCNTFRVCLTGIVAHVLVLPLARIAAGH